MIYNFNERFNFLAIIFLTHFAGKIKRKRIKLMLITVFVHNVVFGDDDDLGKHVDQEQISLHGIKESFFTFFIAHI